MDGISQEGPLNANVIVLYDPANPNVTMIDRMSKNWLPWAPMMGVGTFLVLVGIGRTLKPPASLSFRSCTSW